MIYGADIEREARDYRGVIDEFGRPLASTVRDALAGALLPRLDAAVFYTVFGLLVGDRLRSAGLTAERLARAIDEDKRLGREEQPDPFARLAALDVDPNGARIAAAVVVLDGPAAPPTIASRCFLYGLRLALLAARVDDPEEVAA